jgi:hypothetical protein
MKYLLLVICIIAPALLLPAAGRAQDENRAGLVVRFGDGHVEQTCVSFPEASISGEELLARSGLPVIVQAGGVGSAVCKIGDEGCNYPAESCFCKCSGGACAYWAFSRQVEGAWRYSNQGASGVQAANGDVHGWAWGAGSVQSGAAPPLLSFAQLCAVDDAPAEPPAPAPTAAPPTPPAPTVAPPTSAPPASATLNSIPPATATSAPTATLEPATVTAPAATAQPAISPTQTAASPSPSAAQVAALPAATAQPPPAASVEQPNRAPLGYVAFGALALLLLAGIGLATLRRRG